MNNYDLEMFMIAQNSCWDTVISEMKDGEKITDWIWYVFPQIEGLSSSETALKYAIRTLDEAKSYIKEPVLRERMIEILTIINELPMNDLDLLMGYEVDCLKFASSMTLFEIAEPNITLFSDMFDKFDMDRDLFTLEKLNIDY